uniref:Uncharacterized protein n=1 Tax=Neovison vison TaxID=452646 RepID=A0A8C7BIW3_NEOVI
MDGMLPPGCSELHQKKVTLGMPRSLESSPCVTEVTTIENHLPSVIGFPHGNKNNNHVLPENVMHIYLMNNGPHMTWNVKLDEHTIPLGRMASDCISNLTQPNQSSVYSTPNAPTLADLEVDTPEADNTDLIEHFHHHRKLCWAALH